ERRRDLHRVGHLDARAARGLERAPVADLTAGLRVEGRLRGDDVDGCAGSDGTARLLAVDEQRQDLGLPLDDAGADEARSGAARRRDLRRRGRVREALPAAPARALRFHLAIEAGAIDGEALAAEDVLREIEREAVRVVEAERDFAGQGPPARGSLALDLGCE